MSATFTYEEIEALIGGKDEDPTLKTTAAERPTVKAFKEVLFDKFVKKALWQMRRDNAMTAENIEFQIDVKIEGKDNSATLEKSVSGGGLFRVKLGCCPVDGCGGCSPNDL